MALQRRTYRLRNSWIVALPREVRAHLKLKGGEDVYWHVTGANEVALTKHERREGGRPSLDKLRREILLGREREERLMRRVHQAPAAHAARSENQGYMRALKHMGFGPTWVRDVQKALGEIADSVKWIEAKTRQDRHVRGRPPRRLRRVDAIPLPSSPLSPPSVAGEAGTPGAEPTGAPIAN
jgi:hypothetical protein